MSDSIPSEDALGRLTEYHHLELRDNYRAEIKKRRYYFVCVYGRDCPEKVIFNFVVQG